MNMFDTIAIIVIVIAGIFYAVGASVHENEVTPRHIQMGHYLCQPHNGVGKLEKGVAAVANGLGQQGASGTAICANGVRLSWKD